MKWLLLSAFCVTQLFACTGIVLQTENHSPINGRTVEFGIPLDMNIAVIPRNFAFSGKTPLGKGLAYKSKYAAVGIYGFSDVVLMDGMNEKGLVAASFYFPGYANYSEITKNNQTIALSPADFPNWILTQFASIEEVKEALSQIVIVPTVLEGWGNTSPPLHYVVYDSSGQSIVIEPIDGTLKVYNNKLGVITNSPAFDWHMTNLNNYLNLSPDNVNQNQIGNVSLFPLGQGSGMIGLPGDFTPPSRFVRAAFFSTSAILPVNSDAAVDQAFHILNLFDIPMGAVRQKDAQGTEYDYTLLTSVKNPETLEYYYRSYQDQAIQFVNLNQFDLNAKTVKKMKIQSEQKKHNVSSMLK